ncbi:hypothetical protein Mgra_00004241 [Meloidogyne graminicola]|uniref:EF-hand domain-containing protein n=1 Tax=Meloidogyne graminicola TaxID=189291 RepID=A0A8S9ZS91_9BILA|nr:hypothetical protein Mgra_00004241 [Meloidogyne graminicola]
MDNFLSFNEFISNNIIIPQERAEFIKMLFNESDSDQNQGLNIQELINFFVLLRKQWENHGGTGDIDYSIFEDINKSLVNF